MSKDEQRYNPMDQSSIDKLLEKRAAVRNKFSLLEEEVKDYKKALNRIFGSKDGRYFLKKLIRYIEIHSFDNELNPAKLIEDRGKRRVYLELIRPYLDGSIRAEVEN